MGEESERGGGIRGGRQGERQNHEGETGREKERTREKRRVARRERQTGGGEGDREGEKERHTGGGEGDRVGEREMGKEVNTARAREKGRERGGVCTLLLEVLAWSITCTTKKGSVFVLQEGVWRCTHQTAPPPPHTPDPAPSLAPNLEAELSLYQYH